MNDYYAVVRSGAEDTLQHYGVLGMRWGIRRDRRVRMAKASYKTQRKALKKSGAIKTSSGQRKLAASREQWMKQRENAANRLYSKNSKETNRRIARMSSKQALGQSYLMGSYGALKYNQNRASGKRKVSSFMDARVKDTLNNALLGAPEITEYLMNRRARKKK